MVGYMADDQQGEYCHYKGRYGLEGYEHLEETVTAGLLGYGSQYVVAKKIDGFEEFVGYASVCAVRLY
jgi:hypothetical protein